MRLALRAAFFLVVVLVTAIAAWVASSLASWLGGPRWLAIACALALLPGLPLAWERGAVLRRREAKKKRRVPLPATLAARSLVLGTAFLGFLLSWWPDQTFLALAQRGDWFLDSASPRLEFLRPWTHAGASGLEGLWKRTRPDPYRKWRTEPPRLAEAPKAAPMPRSRWTSEGSGVAPTPVAQDAVDAGAPAPQLLCADLEDGTRICVEAEEPPAVVQQPRGTPAPHEAPREEPREAPRGAVLGSLSWPLPAVLHPAAAAVREDQARDVATLATALTRGTAPGADRLKAIHDWVADHVAYDAEAFRTAQYPEQTAEAVLARRTAVCAGYAALFEALGKAAGEDVVMVTGEARVGEALAAHAWNAVRLNGGWALVDVTWDSGAVTRGDPPWTFRKLYSTDYLLAPPEVFSRDHLPRDSSWQLLAAPRTAADVLAAPRLYAAYDPSGVTVHKPSSGFVEVSSGELVVELDNPRGRALAAQVCSEGTCVRCGRVGQVDHRLPCQFPRPGRWNLLVLASTDGEALRLAPIFGATVQVRN